MIHHRARFGGSKTPPPDMEETKEHIMVAGRELLLAAGGALRFCKSYVETCVPEASRPSLLSFFQKAISTADDLGKGLVHVSRLKETARDIAKPLFTAMEREMREEVGAKGTRTAPKGQAKRHRQAKKQRRR